VEKNISIHDLKTFVENKTGKQILVKMIWNETEKLTLFIKPNMKINSFIWNEKEGYLFFDNKGKMVSSPIPCIIPENDLVEGKASFEGIRKGNILFQNKQLSKKDTAELKQQSRA